MKIDIQDVVRKTELFKFPMLFQNAFDESDFNEWDVVDVLNKSAQTNFDTLSQRVYVENNISNELSLKVHRNQISNNETLLNWTKRIFGSNKFGIVINNAEQYSEKLTLKCGELLKNIITSFGLPSGGFSMAIFIGNYAISPMGAHVDKYLNNVLHFHLGPSNKEMILWEKDKFKEITGIEGKCYTPLEYKKFGQSFILTKNSIFNLPASDYFHVGCNEGLSIAITIGLLKVNTEMFIENSLTEYLQEFYKIKKNDKKIKLFDDFTNEDSLLKTELNNISMLDFINKSVDFRRTKFLENNGFIKKLLTKS